jgi:hypothetical protein
MSVAESISASCSCVADHANPDCGFAPGSAADVSLDEVYTKLKNEVAAAERLREKYS